MVDRVTLIRRTAAKLSESLGREPTNEEIAETLNLPATRVSHLRNVSTKPASLDSPINEEDGSTLGEVVPDEKSVDPYESLKSKSLIGDVNLVLSMLEPREADIIRLRFGLDGRDPLTLEQVGEQIGITRERVRQLQDQALRDLRKKMAKYEKQRTVEEIKQEEIIAERTKILQDLLHKNTSNNAN